jgi:transposase
MSVGSFGLGKVPRISHLLNPRASLSALFTRQDVGTRFALIPKLSEVNFSMDQNKFVGLEVTGNSIEVAVRPTGEAWTSPSCDEGVAEIADKLLYLHPDLVVMQDYGQPELTVAGVLASVGLPFALIPPRNIREFARAIGRVARDRQASLLAQFAELVQPEPQSIPEEVVQQLNDLQARRRELNDWLSHERTRTKSVLPVVLKDVQNHIQFLERALKMNGEQFKRIVRFGRVPLT